MSLGKRAFVVIFPVVLAGYLLAAVMLYHTQSASVLNLERARLLQEFSLLGGTFRNEVSQNRSLIFSLVKGNAVRQFISEPDASYRSNALGVRLQDSLISLLDDTHQFVSVVIVSQPFSIEYYYENSDNPFADMSPAQLEHARHVLAGSDISTWDYLPDDEAPLIVHSEFVDSVSFGRPLFSAKRRAILVQTAARPTRFLEMKRKLEREYDATVEIADHALEATGDLSVSTQLGPNLFARLSVPPGHMAEKLSGLKLLLAAGALGLSLCTIGLVLGLVRRYITNPIAELDGELTAVMLGRRSELSSNAEAGEIGRLSGNMKRLHDEVVRSLLLVQRACWTDVLTGISNREHFNIRSKDILERAVSEGDNCVLLFIDLDNFKFVNDKHGHKVGDELLKTFAARIKAIVEDVMAKRALPDALFARLSGDEFAIMLRTRAEHDVIDDISSRVFALFSGGFEVDASPFPVTTSIGVAICPHDAVSLDELITHADAAMYQAKSQGKNGLARYSRSLHDSCTRRRRIEDELRSLNPDHEFQLVYMPIVDRSGRVARCEALLRWTSPVLGDVAPDELFPIAETTGLFNKIDAWVVDHALADQPRLRELFGDDTIVCVNISSAELYAGNIADHFREVAGRHGVDPGKVEIELTETFAVKHGTQTQFAISGLREAGFQISIDDFGAGYTSVQQIMEYPAETIKLDRALVESLTKPLALDTLRALISLCHAQRMSVVAEGVDSSQKMDLLIEMGCDFLQGFLISRPLPLEELGIWSLQRMAEHARKARHEVSEVRSLPDGAILEFGT